MSVSPLKPLITVLHVLAAAAILQVTSESDCEGIAINVNSYECY